MRVCILCEDSKVELARQNSKAFSNNKVKLVNIKFKIFKMSKFNSDQNKSRIK